MMHLQRRRSPSVLLATVFFSLSLPASSAWAAGDGARGLTSWWWHRPEGVCFETTQKMKKACRADTVDNLYEQSAKCLNTDEPFDCRREAYWDFYDEIADCEVQAAGRDDLCRRLPDPGPYIIDLDPADFDGGCPDGNEYFPLVVGTVTTFVNETEDEEETIIVTVTDETREIEGIEAIVVRDTVYEGLPDDDFNPTGDRIEDTDDYYAVANNCDVWYLGEVSQSFEDGYLDNLDGSFIAGQEEAQAGIIMLGDPMVGDVYRQEFALGDAEDAAEVLSLATDIFDEDNEVVEFDDPDFNCNNACLMTEDFIANEPDGTELKYFKSGIGFVAEQLPDGEVVLKLVRDDVLP
jgi:hypothetical protein